MGKVIDLTGQRFGQLVVIEKVDKPQGSFIKKNDGSYWLCECDDGMRKIVSSRDLRSENIKSFGSLIGKRFGNLAVLDSVQK